MPRWLVRLWLLPAALLLFSTGALLSKAANEFYDTYLNPVPLLYYDYNGASGIPTDRPIYRPGETISLLVTRCVRELGSTRNQIYLSTDGTPRGALIAVIDSTVMPGCTTRLATVASIPPDTEPDRLYTLAGVNIIISKSGTLPVQWRSTTFYVTR